MTENYTDEFAAAMAKAQGEMTNAKLNKTNPHFKSKYADLAAIRDTVVPALSKHGICVIHRTEHTETTMTQVTTLRGHGGFVESHFPIRLDAIQKIASQLTYARRYNLSGLCCISADEDDDAEGAEKTAKAKTPGANLRRAAGAVEQAPEPKPGEEPPAPPKGVTALKARATQLNQAMNAASDYDSLTTCWSSHAELLEDMKRDIPDWYTAAASRYAELEEKLAAQANAPPL